MNVTVTLVLVVVALLLAVASLFEVRHSGRLLAVAVFLLALVHLIQEL